MQKQIGDWRDDVTLSYALLRVTLGANICMHGVVRWSKGLSFFAASLTAMFQKTLLPSWTVYSFGYILPVIEALLGFALLIGIQTRRVLVAGAFVMLLLTFGSTLREDWQVAGLQLIYSLTYVILLAGARFDRHGVSAWLEQRSSETL